MPDDRPLSRLAERFGLAAAAAALPERVQQAIAAEEQRGEVLVGWVQMAVVLVVGTLYVAAPKTFSADVPFEPVPWALGAYFLFTALRLRLAYRMQLPAWFLAASVVVDMTLLMVTIWSFHLQYGQPAAFYLKAPALLYVFVFIALRALRFQARYVLLSGFVAAAGWLVLVVYAAVSDADGMPVTRDYVKYMSSASILWGAEIDKMVTILIVTFVLAAALTRGRRLLVRAVAEESAARDLSRFFEPEIARRIVGSETGVKPGQGEVREAATLFVDLRGFTALAQRLDANALVAFLTEYQARLVPVIQAHGGRVDKFLGDGIMASFGAVAPSATYGADALRAVDALMAEAATWLAEREGRGLPCCAVGAAVAVGPVLFGAVGDDTRLEYTVIGEAVNLAAKLEKHTKTEGVRALAPADAFAVARAQGYVPPAPRAARRGCAVAGVDQPLDLVVLA